MKCLWEVEREANAFYWNTGSVSIFPAIYWLLRAVFTGWGFLGMLNTMLKFKMTSLPVLLVKQEVPVFSCLESFDLCRFLMEVSLDDEHYGRYFLFLSPNRKCQCFPVCNWLIRAIFSGRRFLWMRNAMVKFKMASLPVLLPKQEVSVFSCM